MKNTYKQINQFVLNFLSSCDKNKLTSTWKSDGIQELLRNIVGENVTAKRPRHKSGYQLYSDEFRAVVQKENPTWPMKKVLSEIAARWQRLKLECPEEVQRYEAMAAEDKKRKDEMYTQMQVDAMQERVHEEDDDEDDFHADKEPPRARHQPALERLKNDNRRDVHKMLEYSSSEDEAPKRHRHHTPPPTDKRFDRYVKHKLEKVRDRYSSYSTDELIAMMKDKWAKMPESDRARY